MFVEVFVVVDEDDEDDDGFFIHFYPQQLTN